MKIYDCHNFLCELSCYVWRYKKKGLAEMAKSVY